MVFGLIVGGWLILLVVLDADDEAEMELEPIASENLMDDDDDADIENERVHLLPMMTSRPSPRVVQSFQNISAATP